MKRYIIYMKQHTTCCITRGIIMDVNNSSLQEAVEFVRKVTRAGLVVLREDPAPLELVERTRREDFKGRNGSIYDSKYKTMTADGKSRPVYVQWRRLCDRGIPLPSGWKRFSVFERWYVSRVTASETSVLMHPYKRALTLKDIGLVSSYDSCALWALTNSKDGKYRAGATINVSSIQSAITINGHSYFSSAQTLEEAHRTYVYLRAIELRIIQSRYRSSVVRGIIGDIIKNISSNVIEDEYIERYRVNLNAKASITNANVAYLDLHRKYDIGRMGLDAGYKVTDLSLDGEYLIVMYTKYKEYGDV